MFLVFGISTLLAIPVLIYFAREILAMTLTQWLIMAHLASLRRHRLLYWNKCINVLALPPAVCSTALCRYPPCCFRPAASGKLAWLQLIGGALALAGVLIGMRNAKLPVNYETGQSL